MLKRTSLLYWLIMLIGQQKTIIFGLIVCIIFLAIHVISPYAKYCSGFAANEFRSRWGTETAVRYPGTLTLSPPMVILDNHWNPVTWVFIWKCLARALKWIYGNCGRIWRKFIHDEITSSLSPIKVPGYPTAVSVPHRLLNSFAAKREQYFAYGEITCIARNDAYDQRKNNGFLLPN